MLGFFCIDNCAGRFINNNCAFNVTVGGILTWRLYTVAALVGEKKPTHLSVDLMLVESNELVVKWIEVRGILMCSLLLRSHRRQAMPFLAGHLAAATCGAA
ncbi:hypothetical protein PITCH_A780005 [uncultured Desulfobacterium sp.]|uniref:Uncharacterized protein n=1 Tax=uncultured Desulfobacterium sp. TaxID=201089 RepID=A0A445N2E5_9BACT|nr:hypothetical protein PITCH_A780005 [uncultured Desulfobacterium sp.]